MTEQTTPVTVRGTATRDFNDAGTEPGTARAFTKGKTYDLEQGVFDNYAHAGLVTEADAAPAAAPAPAADPAEPFRF